MQKKIGISNRPLPEKLIDNSTDHVFSFKTEHWFNSFSVFDRLWSQLCPFAFSLY